jgi:hypothetical protein
MSYDHEYIALVSQFVEEGENDPEVVQKMLEFLWEGGLRFCSRAFAGREELEER